MSDLTIQSPLTASWRVIPNGGVDVKSAGSKRLTQDGIGVCPLGAMNPNPGAVNIVEEHEGTLHRTIITLTNVAVATTDHTTAGAQGTQLLYTFPRGLINLLNAVSNLTITGDGTNIGATAAVVSSVGSVVAGSGDATLSSTEADMIPSYAATLTGSAGVVKGLGQTARFYDNTTNTNATQLTANMNFAIPDTGSSANGTITVSGTITLNWMNAGDN